MINILVRYHPLLSAQDLTTYGNLKCKERQGDSLLLTIMVSSRLVFSTFIYLDHLLLLLLVSIHDHFKLTGLLDQHQFFVTYLTVKRTVQQKYQQALGN